MIPTSEIIAVQIANRCCRRGFQDSGRIKSIMEECCETLNIPVPNLICCETMAKNFSAFYLRKEPYLIYDSCLAESLFLYNNILDTGIQSQDMEKFFYKLIGEELLREEDYIHCMYFSGKYRNLEYSFEKRDTPNEIIHQVSCQSYFLLAHELTHLSLHGKGYSNIPDGYRKFLDISFKVLNERARDNGSEKEFLLERYGYFLDECPKSLEEYYRVLPQSNRYRHFVEECYCDFRGMQLLLEHYAGATDSICAISNALNYLITQEFIRSDLVDGALYVSDTHKNATFSMYLSVLRMEMLLVTIQFNNLKGIDEAFREMKNRFQLIDFWKEFVKKLPSAEALSVVSDKDIPNIDKKKLISILLKVFYYCHFD